MISYRSFNNFDPPVVADLWNACFSDPSSALLRTPALLEYLLFSKPYFESDGLILAEIDQKPVGFVLGGFGPSADGSRLDRSVGVCCALGVAPPFRCRGIGSELLFRLENYLRKRGASKLFAGPLPPSNPFNFALSGGSQTPGFLDSTATARPFFERRNYQTHETTLIYRLNLDHVPDASDGRFAPMRQRYEIQVSPRHGLPWYQECVLGPIELHDFRLRDKATQRVLAHVSVWEMETYRARWNEHAVGIVEIETEPDMRGQGLAKFLLSMLLRHLKEQFFTLVEVQAPETNEPARQLLQTLGFLHTDTGRRFRREIVA